MECNMILQLIRDNSKLIKIFACPDEKKVYVGDVPAIYINKLSYWSGKQNYESSNLYKSSNLCDSSNLDEIILLPTYTKELGEFFVYVINNMYCNLELSAKQLIWFCKIHDEYGLPSEIFKVFSEIDFTQVKAFEILIELTRITYEGILFPSKNIEKIEKDAKKWLSENFDDVMITYDALALAKVRTFMCHLLKTFNFGCVTEADILKSLVKVICECDKQTTIPLSEKCINDLMACIQWHNVPIDVVNEVILLLSACPNFKLNNTITNGIKKREILSEKYNKKEKKKFKYEKGFYLRDCYSNIKHVHAGCNSINLYATTIEPTEVVLTIGVFPNKRDDDTKTIIIYKQDGGLYINVTVEYEHAGKLLTGNTKWVFKGNNKLFINIPVEVDNKTIKIIFSEVVCMEKIEEKKKIEVVNDGRAIHDYEFDGSDSDDDWRYDDDNGWGP